MDSQTIRRRPSWRADGIRTRGLAALAVLATIGWAASPGRAFQGEKKAEPADPVETLIRAELKLAIESLDKIARMRQIGAPVNLSVSEYSTWSRRVLEARIFLNLPADQKAQDVEVYLAAARGGPVAERVGYFEEHLGRMTYLEGQNRILQDRQQISALDFANVEFLRRQAEVWLAREKGRRASSSK